MLQWSSSSGAVKQVIWLLNHCSNLKHLHQTHAFMLCRALDHDNLLLSLFIQSSSSLGFSLYAYSLFTSLTHPPNIFLYNTIIRALSLSPQPSLSIFLFNRIQSARLRPDSYSFPFALKAVIRLSATKTGLQFHSQAIRFGLHSHLHVLVSLIRMYSSSHISDARKLFDGIPLTARNVALWNAMLTSYAKICDMPNAQHLFDSMPQRNLISWTALISGYAHINRPHQAIAIFRTMQLQNVVPDEITLLAVLSACAQLGALELGEWIRNYIDIHGLHRNVPLHNALIDMYAKSGNIKRALLIFESMKHKTIVTWTTMIAGLALHGLGTQALEMFSRMERDRVKPNEITFIAVLSACSHVGLVQLARSFFTNMRSRYTIQPKIEHYGCMIDLLGRAGYLQEAQQLLQQMPFEPNAAIWGSLLAASYTHGDAMLGERTLKHLIELEPNNSGNYALLSNIYASLGRWKASRIVRKMMRDRGVKKIPGGSFIEVNNRVNEFIAGETSHPQFDEIYEVIYKINEQSRLSESLEKECFELLEFGEE
ncbi:pentatricopeptide repeat-containing protein, putative [Ricinus communis]|uniref:Pentatricopeptide repeat-containing protein, putative n=2 Tax=Ricinus communis TaxID=3988 RepID=B9SBL5_RICCO|nr:pentatricopeptide repeat-containing protein, putative [Ricinus communis]